MKWSALFLVFLFFAGCESPDFKTGRSFYFWRTVFNLNKEEQQELMHMGVHRLYIRFFDVDLDVQKKQTRPIEDIRFVTQVDSLLELVPVVFITNRSILQNADSAMPILGLRIVNRIKAIEHSLSGQHLKEVQLDCDWTETGRDKYFSLLETLRSEFKKDKILLSATIRLHQVKYFQRTGVPPVDKGMLMFYNMGKLDDANTANSIYDQRTASAYLSHLSSYPLPLDLALPCFSWMVVIQNNHVVRLVNDVSETELASANEFERIGKNQFRVKLKTKLGNTDLFEGQTLRLERVDVNLCDQAARQIQACLAHRPGHVAIFHLKKNQFSAYEKQVFESVYNRFD